MAGVMNKRQIHEKAKEAVIWLQGSESAFIRVKRGDLRLYLIRPAEFWYSKILSRPWKVSIWNPVTTFTYPNRWVHMTDIEIIDGAVEMGWNPDWSGQAEAELLGKMTVKETLS